jgi:hypothetical protein
VKIFTMLTAMVAGSWMIAAGGAAPVIGTVISSGAFRLNGDTVQSNGTLLDGAVLESGRAASSIQLSNGTRLWLGPAARGKLYGDRMILEKGEARMDNIVGFRLEALGLVVRPDRATTSGQIGLMGSNRVRVAARTGGFRVWNARGVLVANVAAGSALAFEPQAAAAAAVTHITGTLTEQSGHFLLTDQVTHVTVEVTGRGLHAQVGQTVEVTGTLNASATPVAGATQVIAAASVQTVATGATAGGAAGAAAPAGTGGAAAGAGIGLSVTTIAIIGGVAAAATLGGLAASDALPGQGASAPLSR